MSDMPQPDGPSHETLSRLRGMLPSFIRGMVRKKLIGKGKAIQTLKPRQCCRVCGLLFDKALMPANEEQPIARSLCKTCGPLLKQGCIAFVHGNEYSIVKSAKFHEWHGKIVHVHEREMEAIKKEFGELKYRTNGANRESDTPETA